MKTAKSRKAKRQEARQESVNDVILTIALLVLRKEFGFGEVRLDRFYRACVKAQRDFIQPGQIQELL